MRGYDGTIPLPYPFGRSSGRRWFPAAGRYAPPRSVRLGLFVAAMSDVVRALGTRTRRTRTRGQAQSGDAGDGHLPLFDESLLKDLLPLLVVPSVPQGHATLAHGGQAAQGGHAQQCVVGTACIIDTRPEPLMHNYTLCRFIDNAPVAAPSRAPVAMPA